MMRNEISVKENEGMLIVEIKGEIDNSVTRIYREQIDSNIISKSLKFLIIDFKNVSFVDSSGIAFIIGRYNLMKREQGVLYLSNINDFCEKIFKISGILRLVKSFSNLEEAKKEVISHESYRIKI